MNFPLRRTALVMLALAAIALGPAGDARAAPDDVISARLAWEGGNPVPALPGTIELSFARPRDVEPPQGAGDLRYGRVPLPAAPQGGVRVAVDLTPRVERIWIDTDLDGQLNDEKARPWQRAGLRWFVSARVRVPVKRETKSEIVVVPVRVWRGAFRPEDEFVVEARAHRWGAAPVGNTLMMVSLEDVNGDLRFTAEAGDRVYVDVDGDGRYDARPGSDEIAIPGGTLVLGGVRRRVRISEDGAFIEFVVDNTPDVAPLARAGEPVAPPTEDFVTLFARFGAERRSSVGVRRATLARIGALGTGEALAMLDHVARSDLDSDVREFAIESLGNPAFVAHGTARVAALAHSRSARLATAAIRALHAMDHPERTAIYAELMDRSNVRIVHAAARHLAAIDTAKARAAILHGVAERAAPEMRLAAYRGARSGPLGVSAHVRLTAASDLGEPLRMLALRDCLDAREPRVRKLLHTAATELSPRSDGEAILPLLARCGDRDCVDAIIRIGAARHARLALELLIRLDDPITAQRLGAALDDGDVQERAFVAGTLGLRGDPRAVGRLLARLEDETEGYVRRALLRALGDLGETRAISSLAHATAKEGGGGPRALYTVLATPWVRGVREALSAFRLGLREEHWRMRELALRTIAAAGEMGVLREVRDALRDPHRQVRVAAVETLGEVRDAASVRPLMDLLRLERSQRVRDATGVALFHLTGVNLYDDLDLWRKWWVANAETFRVPAKMPMLPPAAVAGTHAPAPPKFYGIPIDTDSVVFVIDQSGSMAGGGSPFIGAGVTDGSKFQTAVKELLAAVEDLEDGTTLNVILFETGVRSWRRGMQKLSKATRKSLRKYLLRLSPEGATNLYDGLDRALKTERVDTIVVLSDGEPTHGRFIDANSILAAVKAMNERRGVVIHCVSIGGGSSLLRRLAAANDGEYVTR